MLLSYVVMEMGKSVPRVRIEYTTATTLPTHVSLSIGQISADYHTILLLSRIEFITFKQKLISSKVSVRILLVGQEPRYHRVIADTMWTLVFNKDVTGSFPRMDCSTHD